MKILGVNNHNQRLIGSSINLYVWQTTIGHPNLLPPDHEIFEVELHTDPNQTNLERKYFLQILNVQLFLRHLNGPHYTLNTLAPIDIHNLNAATLSLNYISKTEIWAKWFTPYGSHFLAFDAGHHMDRHMPFNLDSQCFWMSQSPNLIALAQGIHGRTAEQSPLRVLSPDVIHKIIEYI